MTEFFDILDKLSPGKSWIRKEGKINKYFLGLIGIGIGDLYNLFSNKYLDNLFKPQWQRFNAKRIQAEPQPEEEEKKNAHQSECCTIV